MAGPSSIPSFTPRMTFEGDQELLKIIENWRSEDLVGAGVWLAYYGC